MNTRPDDPATSHEAGATMVGTPLRDQQALVLRTIDRIDRGASAAGATAFEVARYHLGRIQQNVAAKRCTELRELGLIEDSGTVRTGSSCRLLTVWLLTDAGRTALSKVER